MNSMSAALANLTRAGVQVKKLNSLLKPLKPEA